MYLRIKMNSKVRKIVINIMSFKTFSQEEIRDWSRLCSFRFFLTKENKKQL